MSIQILGYRTYQFLNPKTELYENKISDKFFERGWRAPSVKELFLNLDSYIKDIPEDERWDLHYTLADCYESKRMFKKQNTLAIDIDKADVEKVEYYLRHVAKITQLPKETFAIVTSGGGIHFLWELNNYFAESEEALKEYRKAYVALCRLLQKSIEDDGLPGTIDQGIIMKSATLRLPGTENRKYTPPRKAVLVKSEMETVDWDIWDVTKTSLKTVAGTLDVNELKKFPTPDVDFIKQECGFLRSCYNEPDKVTEQPWYAALSIVGRFPGGTAEAHKMSEGHYKYTFEETEAKAVQAIEKSGPATCARIGEFSAACETCPHRGSITSPIQLRGKDFIATKDTGFWIIVFDKKKGPYPSRPDYEGLRRYFEEKYQYLSTESGNVYTWANTHWVPMADLWIKNFAQENLDPKPNSGQVMEFVNLIQRTNPIKQEWFEETTRRRLNLGNGVLDLESMELQPHGQNFGFTKVLPYNYDKDATCPRFDLFMDEITCTNEELKRVLMEFMGYSFSGMEYQWHKCLMMTGDGSNGKSTFIDAMKALAGGSYSTLLLDQVGSEVSRHALIGRLFNMAEETPRKSLFESSLFKILSSGGEYTAKQLYHQPIEIQNNRTKFIFACNELPDTNDFTHGMIRRLLIVPFNATFTDDNMDTKLKQKLLNELPGILNRVIEGYFRLRNQDGFTKSSTIAAAIEEYKESQDVTAAWLHESIDYDNSNDAWFISSTALYTAYTLHCRKIGAYHASQTTFGKIVKRALKTNSETKRINGRMTRGYSGINPNSPALVQSF